MIRYYMLFMFIIASCSSTTICNAKESPFYHIQPIKIIDGDTFHGTHENFPIKVRLYGIDAPEKGEAFFHEAKDTLKETLAGKESIAMELFYFDKYNRAVGIAYLGNGETAQEILLALGVVKISEEHCKIKLCEYWKAFEENARKKELGLWKYSN